MERIIFHIDVNAAFLSWEAVYRLKHKGGCLDLRQIPSAVGGDREKRHGIILAKSLPAKQYGIQTGETILEARRKCPKLVLVPPNYNLYERCSHAMLQIMRDYSDAVEQYSIDEAFLDMTDSCQLFGTPQKTAERMKDRIREELGFTVNVGISHNKLLAKMASDFQKPDRVHTLYPTEIAQKMWPLPVSDLFFVGRATTRRLLAMGIRTIGELAAADSKMLRSSFRKHGEVIWNFANGLDASLVLKSVPANQGYGNSTTLPFDVSDAETAKKVLLALSETVANRLRGDRVKAGVVSVSIKGAEMLGERFPHISHQKVLCSATHITSEIYGVACQLFEEAWDGSSIRHLGIHTSRVVPSESGRQRNLFDTMDYEKLETLDETVDTIRERFGIDAVMRATFLQQPIDHMSGGIAREKREVDYSKLRIE